MSEYKIVITLRGTSVARVGDGAGIPCDIRNMDCRQFLEDWKAGAVVTNPDGSAASYSNAAVEALGLVPTL